MSEWKSQDQTAIETIPQYQYARKLMTYSRSQDALAKHWAWLAQMQMEKKRREATEAVIWRIKHGRYMDPPEHYTVAILGEDGRIGAMTTRPNQTGRRARMYEDFQYAVCLMEPIISKEVKR